MPPSFGVEPPRKTPQPNRARWAEDLVQWCRDRGIKSDIAIAKFLEVDRSTLWRWKRGGRITPANVATILDKTLGQIDPGKRR